MHLRDYFPTLSSDERKALAAKVRVSVGHLRNSLYGTPLSALVVARLEHHTGGKVTRKAHYPENYAEIWPELIGGEDESPIVSNTTAAQTESGLANA